LSFRADAVDGRRCAKDDFVNISTFPVDGPLLLEPRRFGDDRGFFSEVFRQDAFDAAAGPTVFVQDNHSRSAKRGTIRGLHYQRPPVAQGKLVRVTRGAVIDIAVDVRNGSPTYGQHVSVELSESNWRQLWVPPGFLHGFCTLTADCEFLYKVTAYYSQPDDGAVRWNDPALAIEWPVPEADATLSAKDAAAPLLAELPPIFTYGG
jgi:dTDP-4-dehydrorhamnose 3,5-epimerase